MAELLCRDCGSVLWSRLADVSLRGEPCLCPVAFLSPGILAEGWRSSNTSTLPQASTGFLSSWSVTCQGVLGVARSS